MTNKSERASNERLACTLAPDLAYPGNETARREAFDEREDANPAAEVGQHRALTRIQRVRPVIAALDVHVGPHNGQEPVGAFLREDDDGIDARQRGQHGGTLALGDERAPRALEFAHGAVSVEADDEQIAKSPGALQIADVPEVDQVETSIGGHDAATAPTRRGGPLGGLGQG